MDDMLKKIEYLENQPMTDETAGELIIMYEDLLLSNKLTKEGQIFFSIKYASLLNAFEAYEEAYEALVHLDLSSLPLSDKAYINSLLGSLSLKLNFEQHCEQYLDQGARAYRQLIEENDIYTSMYANALLNLANYYHNKKMHSPFTETLEALNLIDPIMLKPIQIHEICFNNIIQANEMINHEKFKEAKEALEYSELYLDLFESKHSRYYYLYSAIHYQQKTRLLSKTNMLNEAIEAAKRSVSCRIKVYEIDQESQESLSHLTDSYLALATLQRNANDNKGLINSLEESIKYLMKSYQPDDYQLAPIYLTLCEALSNEDQHLKVIGSGLQALAAFENYPESEAYNDQWFYDRAIVNRLISISHLGLKNYQSALDYSLDALENLTQLNNLDSRHHFILGSQHLVIGEANYYLGNFEKSLHYLDEAIRQYDIIKIVSFQYMPLIRLKCQNYLALKQYPQAQICLSRLSEILETAPQNDQEYLWEEQVKTNKLYTKYYQQQQEFDKAIDYCLIAADFSRKLQALDESYLELVLVVYQELAFLYHENGDDRYHDIQDLIVQLSDQ